MADDRSKKNSGSGAKTEGVGASDDARAETKTDFKATQLLGEAAKKLFSAGVSAAFMTEENIRSYLGELKLPKEMLTLIVSGAAKSKDEITARVSKEIVALIEKVDWAKEAARFAETHKFKITAEFEVLKKDPRSSSESADSSK